MSQSSLSSYTRDRLLYGEFAALWAGLAYIFCRSEPLDKIAVAFTVFFAASNLLLSLICAIQAWAAPREDEE